MTLLGKKDMLLRSDTLWKIALEDLKQLFPADVFKLWLECLVPGRLEAFKGKLKFTLLTPNEFARIWIEDNYRDILQKRIRYSAGIKEEITLEFASINRSLPIRRSNPVKTEVKNVCGELVRYLKSHPTAVYALHPRRFEMLVADILKDQGYDVMLTPASHDGGKDILASLHTPLGPLLTLVECKRFNPSRKVGIEIAERFLFTVRDHQKASCGLIATTSYFTSGAKALQREYTNQLRLSDFDQFAKWLEQYGTWSGRNDGQLWNSIA